MRIREQLERIPDLAVEVELTRDAPNPTGRVERHPITFESKPPTDIGVIDALRTIDPDDESTHVTPLWSLVEAVKAAWKTVYNGGGDVSTLPPAAETPTYVSETRWLLQTIMRWEIIDTGLVRGFISDAYTELSRLARVPPPILMTCLIDGCYGIIDPASEMCEFGHVLNRHDVVTRAKEDGNFSIKELAEEFGIARTTLYKWRDKKYILPQGVNSHGDQVFNYAAVRKLAREVKPPNERSA